MNEAAKFEEEAANPGPPELDRRLAFLELGPEDRSRLFDLKRTLSRSTDEFVGEFYNHLLSFADTARLLTDSALVERLKTAQKTHLESMLNAEWNEEYAKRRRHVGDMHAEAGVSPEIFVGAYMQYLKHCGSRICDSSPEEIRAHWQQIQSLLKVVFLDIGLTLDAYFNQATASLRQAIELLMRANDELRQFAYLTSHDLKTPLATVANLCDETLDEFGSRIPDEARGLIEAARNRVFRMSATIDELLTSTLQSNEGSDSEFSAQAVLEDLLEQLRPALYDKAIEVIVASDLPRVRGDRARIREAFYNILSNAVKFIDKRPGRIAITVERRDEECVFSFDDNGPGIAPQELEHIFTPFRALRQRSAMSSSGLGLFFAKSLIEHEGGRVWAESVLGKGSRFYVALSCQLESDSR
jgi:signal transduction histidine kinase